MESAHNNIPLLNRQALQHEDSATSCRYLGIGWEEQLRDEIEAMQKHW